MVVEATDEGPILVYFMWNKRQVFISHDLVCVAADPLRGRDPPSEKRPHTRKVLRVGADY